MAATSGRFKNDLVRLGERARVARVAAGLTQQQVADALEMHRVTFNRFEAGENDLPSSKLLALAEVLRVNPSALFDEPTADLRGSDS
ncbi:helix-turn-helix domain-containing protein [Nocardioides sp.]|uniref:helix-turn-helix domain-containing protein n=1 Tax=Nocardioides sp. TaxID=35761 RepID=UPI00351E18D9